MKGSGLCVGRRGFLAGLHWGGGVLSLQRLAFVYRKLHMLTYMCAYACVNIRMSLSLALSLSLSLALSLSFSVASGGGGGGGGA